MITEIDFRWLTQVQTDYSDKVTAHPPTLQFRFKECLSIEEEDDARWSDWETIQTQTVKLEPWENPK